MDLELSVKEFSALLSSTRANDRKKSAEALKDLLSRNALPSLLTKNTLKKRDFTWNDLFDDINDFILKETEKFETSKSFVNIVGPLCSGLLHMCVAGANKGKAYIKCNKILDACLFILKNNRLIKAVGDAYLNLLYRHVLSCTHYLGHITPSNWEDLLDVCITVCSSNDVKLDTYTKLRLLALVIKNGTQYCQFVIPIRNSVSRLRKEFLHLPSDKKNLEVVIDIVILLLEKLSAESRLLMCEFSESVFPVILQFYDRNLEPKKKGLLFKLFEVTVSLHHPKGRTRKEDGSLAHSWNIWERHIGNISEIISLEIFNMQKMRKQNDGEGQNIYFCLLAAKVYYQLFHPSIEPSCDSECSGSSSVKKQKVGSNQYKTFSDLIYQLQLNHLPWLAIIHAYIQEYETTISTIDYLSLMKVADIFINSVTSIMDWESLSAVVCVIIKNLILTKQYQMEVEEAFLTMWNSCVRNSSSTNIAYKSYHNIIQVILKTKCLKYENVQPLMKLYNENAIAVNNSSVMTLSIMFNIFFNKCSLVEQRKKFILWYFGGDFFSVDIDKVKELLLRFVSNNNLSIRTTTNFLKNDKLFEILFSSFEHSLLFSDFELENVSQNNTEIGPVYERTEINAEISIFLQLQLESKVTHIAEVLKSNNTSVLNFCQTIRIAITYLDVALKYNLLSKADVESLQIYKVMNSSFHLLFVALVDNLKSNSAIPLKIQVLQFIQEMLLINYESFLASDIRLAINEDFFHYANNVLTAEPDIEDDLIYEDDENEIDAKSIKYHYIYTLAAYCRVKANFREELLELLLDTKLYNFTSGMDIKCAYRCIEVLSNSGSEDPPIDQIFIFMQHLCKDLFRVPDATFGLLSIFYDMIDTLWSQEDMKQNSYIMIKGYLERSDKLFYPPALTVLIYKCISKIIVLNSGELCDVDEHFMKAIIMKSRCSIHSVRLYCCYLLDTIVNHSRFDIDTYISNIADIFVVNVSESQQNILIDESANRTSTILHSLIVLATSKKHLIRKIVTLIIMLQKEKCLDIKIVKKVLNKLTTKFSKETIDVYLNRNFLSLVYFWFLNNYPLKDLPLSLFNIRNHDELLEKHMKWLVSAEVIWHCGGNINESIVLKQAHAKLKIPIEKVIEICFCNIIVLCLPYIVCEKYKLSMVPSPDNFKQGLVNANRLFQATRQILESEKWSNLFVENIGQLLLFTATHLRDRKEACEQLQVDVHDNVSSYTYPNNVFNGILKYFGELTDGDIMHYLCENQPVAIFKILLKLWENVINEKIFEYKVLCIHSFKSFVERIPLIAPSNAFICVYVCSCYGSAIKKSQDKREIKVLTKSLNIIFHIFVPGQIDVLRKAISQLISVLIIKKEEGFGQECLLLLNYLVEDISKFMKQEDVVDFVKSMPSQSSIRHGRCSSLEEFADRIKSYKETLTSPSYETLVNLRQFMSTNKQYVKAFTENLENVRFSEDSGASIVHQIIYKLSTIFKCRNNQKITLEAGNCLANIGTYDLKTLVTVPPSDSREVVAATPRLSLAIATVLALSDLLFDENPVVTSKIANTFYRFFQYQEGEKSIESVQIDKQILKPFLSDQANKKSSFRIDEVKFNCFSRQNFMVPENGETYKSWVIKQTMAIIDILASDSNYFNSLKEVCVLKPEACQIILPSLMGLLIYSSAEKQIEIIGKLINQFFEYIWKQSFEEKIESHMFQQNCNYNHKLIIQNMIQIVNFVRLQSNHYTSRPNRITTLNYLNLDYIKVAWAATVADQNMYAVYYGELWAIALNSGVPPSSPEETTELDGGRDLQKILRKSYVSIGELDAIDGCGTAHLTLENEKLKHLIHTGQYLDALLVHDILLSCSLDVSPFSHNLKLRRGVLRSLHKSGLHHLALQYIKAEPENEKLDDIKYECLSVLGDWSDFVDTKDLEEKCTVLNYDNKSILKAFRYACLKDCLNIQIRPELHEKLELPLNRAKFAVSKLCSELNMENCQNVYKVLSKLHLFTDIEDYFAVRCEKLSINELLEKWSVDNLPAFQDFKSLEDLLFQRNIILEHAAKTHSDFLKGVVSLQLEYAELSLSNQRIPMAQRLLAVVKKIQNSSELSLLESQIAWAKGHKDIAISLLRNIVSNSDTESTNKELMAVSLRQYGLWMAESKSDNARDIINKYLKKSLEVLKKDDIKTRRKVHFDIATFADAEYKQVVTYMNSSVYENKVKCLENMKDTATTFKYTQLSTMTKEERKAQFTNEKFKQLEEADIANTVTEKETFLRVAMRYYLLSLKEGEENNLSVFRVISLWLDNPNLDLEEDTESFQNLLHGIPSRKFVAVLPQLAPRLSEENSSFARSLRKLITRCALEHPHHTLPIIFSLKNSDKDKHILNVSQGKSGRGSGCGGSEPRILAAAALVRRVANENGSLEVIVKQMEMLYDATISFANYKPKGIAEQKQKIPSAEMIHKLSRLNAIPIPTVNVPIRVDCNYNFINTLVSFDKYFELVGGINCPKKINCLGSNGIKKILLIKGEDDLRQDAVMQQVFNIVNNLLEQNTITNKNNLTIRTYKVVPMSKQSGVLEWCEGTIPLGNYLVGSGNNLGAHARYRPMDISCKAARMKLIKCQEQRKSYAERLAVFLSILEEFKPVFHYFFTEHYHDPVTWYERRLAYTKSVATSSMVGYILGLGDRHVQNILIDKNTAEVIHIDFGIAFDQGKALPTPETIPFRLTQDLISGFGCSGVEGLFRRSCEKTMQLLRDNQETLLTILEVLLCDPLYSWTVTAQGAGASSSAVKNAAISGNVSNSGLAERALLAVSSKLSGTEGGVLGGAPVAAHVARLIRVATDPANLCRLFHGWQPYL